MRSSPRSFSLLLAIAFQCTIGVGNDAQSSSDVTETSVKGGRTSLTFSPKSLADRRRLNEAVRQAFSETHDGWSSDEVLLKDELNKKFLEKCQELFQGADPTHCNWALLNQRKAGHLKGIATTRRRRDQHDDYLYAAEIAARTVQDKHELSIDRVLCSPPLRREFDDLAASVAPEVSPYLLRKAAFGLRKARQLRPELVARVADWNRQVRTYSAEQILAEPDRVSAGPGIYIFRDQSGYLYIGESSNLRERVTKHLDHSDRKSLAHYLWQHGVQDITVEMHVFDANSKARERSARRAYESELIRSRNPRFNIAP